MFTGIIEDLGKVKAIDKQASGAILQLETKLDLSREKTGDSLAVNGACLTMIEATGHWFAAQVSPETLNLTNLGTLRVNDRVNLERPLTLASRLGGHLVSGHVEETAALLGRKQVGDYLEVIFSCSGQASKYIVKKGSVALDGISLTVADCNLTSFSVVIIPHTAETTTLGIRRVGERMNLETDIIGKYVERLLAFAGKKAGQGVTVELLKQTGFL